MVPSTRPWIRRSSSADKSPLKYSVGPRTEARSVALLYGLLIRVSPGGEGGGRGRVPGILISRVRNASRNASKTGDATHALSPFADVGQRRLRRLTRRQYGYRAATATAAAAISVPLPRLMTLFARGLRNQTRARDAAST